MLDVMDGRFVEGTSLDFDFHVPAGLMYQAHVMAEDPLSRLRRLRGKADTVIMHVETLEDPSEAVRRARSLAPEVYLALSPGTPVDAVEPYLSQLDGVLVMTVQPGRYGAAFIPGCLDKIRHLRSIRPGLTLEVDGGMTPETAALAVEAGADRVASGSYILRSADPGRAYGKLVEAVERARRRIASA